MTAVYPTPALQHQHQHQHQLVLLDDEIASILRANAFAPKMRAVCHGFRDVHDLDCPHNYKRAKTIKMSDWLSGGGRRYDITVPPIDKLPRWIGRIVSAWTTAQLTSIVANPAATLARAHTLRIGVGANDINAIGGNATLAVLARHVHCIHFCSHGDIADDIASAASLRAFIDASPCASPCACACVCDITTRTLYTLELPVTDDDLAFFQ